MNARFPKFLLLLTAFAASLSMLVAASVLAQEQKKISRGSRVAVRNDFGSISITGWDGETIQAVATDESSGETFPVSAGEDSGSNKILITANPDKRRFKGKIKLEVKLPRSAELEPIEAGSDSISVSGLEGFVNAKTVSGDIIISNSGSVQVRTESGNISLENIKGRTEVITANGNLAVKRIQGDVRVIAVNAKINLSCVMGRVEISDTSSQIWLTGIEGDVDVSTPNGKAYFIGAIRSNNRYRKRKSRTSRHWNRAEFNKPKVPIGTTQSRQERNVCGGEVC